jgi:ankyrin repeat protein
MRHSREGSMMRATICTAVALAMFRFAPAAVAADGAAARDTRLLDAARLGSSSTALALLQKRIDPNLAEADGTTPLHWATRHNDIVLMDRLIRAGATPSVANRYGVTPIYLACLNGSAEAVIRLLKAGVNPDTSARPH